MISNNEFANNFGFPTSNDVSRSAHTGSTTRSLSSTVGAAGGPLALYRVAIVAV